MFKRGKDNGHDTGFKCKFKYSFLIFSNVCCCYTLELPHRGKCVPTTYELGHETSNNVVCTTSKA